MCRRLLRLPSPDALTQPDMLAGILEASRIRITPRETGGYSGSTFYDVHARMPSGGEERFILKLTTLADDWFSRRTDDTVGREAAVLLEQDLSGLRELFHLPVRAVALDEGRIGILMENVSDGLLPDERRPLDESAENLLVDRLARLHATFWEDERLASISWLHDAQDFLYIMGPLGHDDDPGGHAAQPIRGAVIEGWAAARPLLPDAVDRALRLSPDRILRSWPQLPQTLIHGDAKVANFAILHENELCALDWAFTGRAPCTFELGWYIAVNAPRLTTSREMILARYRSRLEGHLGGRIDDDTWSALEEAGIVCGALMLLWSKATGVRSGREGADEEWQWWVSRLESWARRINS